MSDLIQRAISAATAIFIAAEETVASDISDILTKLVARIRELEAERDNGWSCARSLGNSFSEWQNRAEKAEAELAIIQAVRIGDAKRAEKAEAERDALRAEGANRYWEGRFRDEKARADKAEAELAIIQAVRIGDAKRADKAEAERDAAEVNLRSVLLRAEKIEATTFDRCEQALRASTLNDGTVMIAIAAIRALATEPAEKETIESLTVERCKKAIISVMYGSPSSRNDQNPPGWHLEEDCTSRDASMHDNGCIDAIKAIRALATEPVTPLIRDK